MAIPVILTKTAVRGDRKQETGQTAPKGQVVNKVTRVRDGGTRRRTSRLTPAARGN